MKYTREFDSIDALDSFVRFHKQENDLEFHWDRVTKRAWIDCDDETREDLRQADQENSDGGL